MPTALALLPPPPATVTFIGEPKERGDANTAADPGVSANPNGDGST